MATINEVRKSINNLFIAEWGNTTPIALDREPFDAPEDSSWVRLTVRSLPSSVETIGGKGNRRFLRPGNVYIQIFTKLGVGTKELDLLTEKAVGIFEGERLDDVWFNEADVYEVDDKKYAAATVSTAFNYEQRK